MIYADNAATTRLDARALEAMLPFLSGEYANASQPYSFARNVKRALKRARETIAECINASPEEIFFTSGGSESDNLAIKGVVSRGDRIVTSSFEHHAVLNSCRRSEPIVRSIVYVDPDKNGLIDPDKLKLDAEFVSIMTVNNELGSIQPIKELCRAAHSRGAIFHTDAVQAVGHMPLDVRELEVDLLSASAHKFNGPKGIGFLFVRNGIKISPLIDGGSQEKNLRAGTENVASIVGMAEALRSNCEQLTENRRRLRALEKIFFDRLDGVSCVRNGSNTLPGLISLSFETRSGETILHRLDLMGIAVSTGSACDGRSDRISHVLKAIGLSETLARGTIRISFGKYNTEEEVVRIADALKRIVSQ